MALYRERHAGPPPRTKTDIDANVWGGLLTLYRGKIGKSWWAQAFPERCGDEDKPWAYATDTKAFRMALHALAPDVDLSGRETPSTLAILDFLEFCSKNISRPTRGVLHKYLDHFHWVEFDVKPALDEWRDEVEAIFRANGIAYRINVHGECERVPEAALEATLVRAQFLTGDPALDALLTEARNRFLAPRPGNYQDAAEKLWDAFERLKTLENPDKAKGIVALLARTAAAPFRDELDAECRALTDLGNDYRIRHHETTKTSLSEPEYQYLFQRLYALMHHLLSATGRLT